MKEYIVRYEDNKFTIEGEKESVEGDLFNKSLWRMGMHDTNVRPCTMADTSTDTDLISRQAAISIPILPKEERKQFKDYDDAFETGWLEALACVNMLPPVEPKPVCEDAISRADTLKAICAECDVNCEDCINKEAYCTEYAVVKSLPPVEPKRPVEGHCSDCKHESKSYYEEPCHSCFNNDGAGYEPVDSERPKGEWIENDDFTCSECGYHMIVGGGAYNFCPSCGCQMERADMRGEK